MKYGERKYSKSVNKLVPYPSFPAGVSIANVIMWLDLL